MNKQTNNKLKQSFLCVGMCVLDIIHLCEQYPEEDTDKRCLQGYWQRGGNASNNCTVLRQLGADCEFLGMLSNSLAFSFLQDECHGRGIKTTNCPSTTQNPPFSSVILSQATGTRTIIHSNNNFPILKYEHFQQLDLNNYNWIHFEARNPEHVSRMLLDIIAYNTTQQASRHISVSLELEKKRTDFLALAELVDYVFIGKDLSEYMGWHDMHEAVYGLRSKLQTQQDKKPTAIICSWGAKGCSCLDDENNYVEVAAQPVEEIVDSLGAGDTFCAATIYALGQLKFSLPDAVSYGNHCAAYKIQYRGYDEIAKFQELLLKTN